MKTILFTHSQDIDGINCIILGKEAFKNFDYIPVKTFDITNTVEEYYNSGKLYEYDLILITDLCIKEPLLSIINKDLKIKNKIQVLDHHKTEIEEGNDKYSFVKIIVEEDGIKQSGTSLLYKFLIENKYLPPNPFLDEFVELTRQYDTWDWKKTNNQKARNIHIIFETLGIDKYLGTIERLKNNFSFQFDEYCNNIITDYNKKLNNNIKETLNKIKIYSINISNISYKIGLVEIPYYLRNDISDYIKENKTYDIDLVILVIDDGDTVSYRSIKDNIDCSKVAEYFGGKGHKNAASSPKDNAKFIKFYSNIM